VRRLFFAVAALAAVLAGCDSILGIADNYLLCGTTGAGGCGGASLATAGAGGGDAGAAPDASR
jgi:hypothetical protein